MYYVFDGYNITGPSTYYELQLIWSKARGRMLVWNEDNKNWVKLNKESIKALPSIGDKLVGVFPRWPHDNELAKSKGRRRRWLW